MEEMQRRLMGRLTENYAGHRASLLLKDRQELIDGADRIAKTAEAFQYLSKWECPEKEMAYLLKLRNPLEAVVDRWESCDFELDALGALVTDMADKEAELDEYHLTPDSSVESGLYLVNGAIYLHVEREQRGCWCTTYDKETMRRTCRWLMDTMTFWERTPEDIRDNIRFTEFAGKGINVITVEAVSLDMLQKLEDIQPNLTLDEYPRPDYTSTMSDIARKGYLGGDLFPVRDGIAAILFDLGYAVYEVDSRGRVEGPLREDYVKRSSFGATFAVLRREWEASSTFQEIVVERMEDQMDRERSFLRQPQDCFAIYQISRRDTTTRHLLYEPMECLRNRGLRPQKKNYELVYTGFLPEGTGPDELRHKFNVDSPPDYRYPSLSVSDVIAVKRDGVLTCHFINRDGYVVLQDFFD